MTRFLLIAPLACALVLGGCIAFIPEQHRGDFNGKNLQKKTSEVEALRAENAQLRQQLSAMKARCGSACDGL